MTEPPGSEPVSTAIIVLNTGCEHHVGPHRMYVPLAREWAAQGHAVFRFDLGGIGESRAPDGAEDYVAYPAHATSDVRAAIAEVRSRCGASRVMLIGICAGGWHAFQAARDGLPVDGILAVNAPARLDAAPDILVANLNKRQWEQRWVQGYYNNPIYSSFYYYALSKQ